jgi:molecular chaperone GrpE
VSVQVPKQTDLRNELEAENAPIGTHDMNPPGSDTGPDAEADDIASTNRSGGRDAKLEADLEELKDRHLRLAAEFDNFRKRSSRERAELADRAQASFVAKLLDVLDDLDRLVASDPATPLPSLREGLSAVDRKLWKELEDAGVERIDPVGSPFDPALHEAVSTVPSPDGSSDHLVSATFQPGYRFKGTLVRPARVQVYSDQGQH